MKNIFKKLKKCAVKELQQMKQGTLVEDSTGKEDHLLQNIDDFVNINKYMITTYSTNKNDVTLSIEGLLPLSLAKKVVRQLDKDVSMWYVIIRFNNETISMHTKFDPNKIDEKRTITMKISSKEEYDSLSPVWKWHSGNKGVGGIYKNDSVPVHFITSDNIKFLAGSKLEIVSNADIKSLSERHNLKLTERELRSLFTNKRDPLVQLIVEDSMKNRKNLYKSLIKFFRK